MLGNCQSEPTMGTMQYYPNSFRLCFFLEKIIIIKITTQLKHYIYQKKPKFKAEK